MFCQEEAAEILEAMRANGATQLHDQVVRFLQELARDAGVAADAGEPLPGDETDDGRHHVEVPDAPAVVSYSPYPGMREFRVTDLVWLD